VAAEHAQREAEFVQLLTRYQPNIFLYIRSLALNPDVAAEVLQETNLVLWEKRDQFERDTNFVAWAFQIARNKLKQHQDSRHRRGPLFSETLIDELAIQSSYYEQSNGDLIDDLRLCMAKLAVNDLQIITERYSSQATCESLAQTFGRPVRWVYNALARIREELLDCITSTSQTKTEKDR
jgi:RNA polymerase sigma-70 factor (ECF subfamily)